MIAKLLQIPPRRLRNLLLVLGSSVHTSRRWIPNSSLLEICFAIRNLVLNNVGVCRLTYHGKHLIRPRRLPEQLWNPTTPNFEKRGIGKVSRTPEGPRGLGSSQNARSLPSRSSSRAEGNLPFLQPTTLINIPITDSKKLTDNQVQRPVYLLYQGLQIHTHQHAYIRSSRTSPCNPMESTLPQVSLPPPPQISPSPSISPFPLPPPRRLPLSHVKKPRKHTHATANSLAGSSADDEALVRDNFPSPYDPKYYESGERQITGKDKAKMGGKFVVLIVVVVLTILGVGAGVGFTIKARA
jgi:hypothetical protein